MEFVGVQLANLATHVSEIFHTHQHIKIWALFGEMGAGKTTFSTKLLQLLGAEKPASSPTYSLVNEYQTPNEVVYHFDLFRIKTIEELIDLDFDGYLSSGNRCIIEWPEIAMPFLSNEEVLYLHFEHHLLGGRSIFVNTQP